MGPVLLILALLFSLLIAVIAIANNDPVPVNYLLGDGDIPLIILILGSAITGAVAMGLFSLFRGIKSAFRFREARRRQDELQEKIKVLEQEKTLLEAELGSHKTAAGSETAGSGEGAAPDNSGEAAEGESGETTGGQ